MLFSDRKTIFARRARKRLTMPADSTQPNDYEREHPMQGMPITIEIVGAGTWEQVLGSLRKAALFLEDRRTRLPGPAEWKDDFLVARVSPVIILSTNNKEGQ